MVVSRSFFLGLLLLAATVRVPAANLWQPLGPDGGTVFAMARDPFTPSRLLAGTHFNGIYRSVDGGMSWSAVPSPFRDHSVFAIAFDPGLSGVVYVGTFEKGIFRSADGGKTWTARNQGLSDLTIQSLAVDPFNRQHLIAGTNSGPFQSSNGGQSWSPALGNATLSVRTVLFDTRVSGVIYLGTIGRGVYRSIDGGGAWQAFNEGLPEVTVNWMGYGEDSSKNIYAATAQGAYVLIPGDTAWTPLFAPEMNTLPVNHILAHSAFQNYRLASTDLGVLVSNENGIFDQWKVWTAMPFRMLSASANGSIVHGAMIQGALVATTDFGVNWVPADHGMQNVFVGALESVASGGQSVVYAGSDRGVYYTKPGVATGTPLAAKSSNFDQGIFSLLRHPTKSGVLFAGTERAGVWRSDNGGTSWSSTSNGILPAQIYDLSQSNQWPYILYAGTSSGLFVSRDGGLNWYVPPRLSIPRILSIATHPNYPGVAYFGSMNGQLFKTIDNGGSIYPASDGLPAENILAIHTDGWDRVYAITSESGLYASDNAGGHWYPSQQGVPHKALAVTTEIAAPWIVYLGTNGGGVWRSVSQGQGWEQLSTTGMDSPYIFSLAVARITMSNMSTEQIYAGGIGQVYYSFGSFQSWGKFGDGLPPGPVTRIVVNPNDPDDIYCSVKDYGVYYRSRETQTWVRINGQPSPQQTNPLGVMPLALGSPDTQRLLIGTKQQGVYASYAKSTWEPINNGLSLFIRTLAFDPKNPTIMYAGSLGDGLFKSTDSGASWQNMGLRDRFIFKIEVNPTTPQTLYAGTSVGVARSLNGGQTWEDMGQQAGFIYAMAADPRNRDIVYAASGGGVLLRSRNGGRMWARVGGSLPALNLLALAIDPTSGTLYVSPERNGVWRSDDGGASFKRLDSAVLYGLMINSLVIDGSGAVYAGTSEGGVFKSVDRGATWKSSSSGLTTFNIANLAGDPLLAKGLYASTYNRGVFKTTNGGLSWQAANNNLTTTQANAVAVDPGNRSIVYAATVKGLFKSTDYAATWKAVNELAGKNITALHLPAGASGMVYAGSQDGEVYRSENGGLNWTRVSSGLRGLPIRKLDGGVKAEALYAATLGSGVARSTDRGNNWFGALASDFVQPFVIALAMDPKVPTTLYAGTSGKGVLKSTNGGIDWAPVNVGLSERFLLCMTIDPQDPRRIFVGTTGGVFVTLNGGDNWQPINDGLFNTLVTALDLDPLDHNTVYCGTEGGGALKLVLDPQSLTRSVARGEWRSYE